MLPSPSVQGRQVVSSVAVLTLTNRIHSTNSGSRRSICLNSSAGLIVLGRKWPSGWSMVGHTALTQSMPMCQQQMLQRNVSSNQPRPHTSLVMSETNKANARNQRAPKYLLTRSYQLSAAARRAVGRLWYQSVESNNHHGGQLIDLPTCFYYRYLRLFITADLPLLRWVA